MRLSVVVSQGIFPLLACCVAAADGPLSYERQIQPILSRACFQCHGPDETARKAKLRLDDRANAFAQREGGAAIVPGKPDESEVIRRITSIDPDVHMPPPKHGERLPDASIALIREWIAGGAAWSSHWSFTAPTRPNVPDARDPDWSANAIDRFIFARLEKEGLRPSPPADRETLLRRLSLDITGLPPSLEEIARAQ